jgi:CHAT domain-containing protein/Tfp pilus assembly protein PilF
MRKIKLAFGVALLSFLVGGQTTAQDSNIQAELDAAFQKGAGLREAGKNVEAIPLLVRALALAPEAFGPDHLNTAGIANTLGGTYISTGQFAEAAVAFRICLEIREKRLGKDHEKVSVALDNLGQAYQRLGQLKAAETYQRRALAIMEAKLPPDHPDLALSLNNIAALYQEMGLYTDAATYFERSLRIQEAAGQDHAGLAYVSSNLAVLYGLMGRFEEAENLARRALRIREKLSGKDHLDVAICLNVLGQVYADMGRHKEAEPLFRRSLVIRETQLGKNHPSVATLLNNLAGALRSMGRFDESETAYRRSLEIAEAVFGPDHPQVATTLANMALLYAELGRDEEAEKCMRRSLQIRENKLGPGHPVVASGLNNLAAFYANMGRYQEAEAMYRRALKIGEACFGKDHLEIAAYLGNLGSVCAKQNREREAEECLLRALRIFEARVGKDNRRLAFPWNNLGTLYWQMGRLDDAAAALERSVKLLEPTQEENPAELSAALSNLTGVYQALNRKEQAWKLEERFLNIRQAGLKNVFAFSSEAAMYSYLQTMSGAIPSSISLALDAAPGPTAAAAFTWVLRLKGSALDTLCRYRQAQHLLAAEDPLTQRIAKCQHVKQLLANAAVNPPQGLTATQAATQMTQWRKQSEDLESEINRAFGAKQTTENDENITAAAVQKRLGPDAALVEFARVPLRDFKSPNRWREHHYVAFVLGPGQSSAQIIDLGLARDIDAGVEAVRKEFADFQDKLKDCDSPGEAIALEKAQEKQFAKVSAGLYQRLLAPLRKALGPAQQLYLAPDSLLNRLPFEALVDEGGKYLVEKYRCAYLSSGRDLLRPTAPLARGTVVFAGPDYKVSAQERLAAIERLLPKKGTLAFRGWSSTDLRSPGWRPLPGAEAEAKDIKKTLQGSAYGPVKSFVGSEALEEVLKAMPAPRILHLATHGFFLDHETQTPMPADNGAGAGWARSRLKHMDNPLLRSGILLAGANTIGDKDATARVEDGWVTAEEIALLNLTGTELVVLSACQTGLGDVKSGEGVFGLRRAFFFAGARTLVTSLFEVPDQDTRDLMQLFYGGLRAGQGKLDALHAAQRNLLDRRRQAGGAAHPFFWASFVMVGDPS